MSIEDVEVADVIDDGTLGRCEKGEDSETRIRRKNERIAKKSDCDLNSH